MIFSTLFGYHGSPSLTEVISYSIYVLVALLILLKPKLLRFNKLTPPA
jgi:high-affinity Fe2+/Pb2+ permease